MDENEKRVIELLKNELKLEYTVCKLLYSKGITTPEEAKKFLYPSVSDLTPLYDLKGIAEAKAEIEKHIAENGKILIYGDYDCDGIGASAILYLTLKKLGADVLSFIPTRAEEGYGFSAEGLEKVLKLAPSLIITVDCGISSPKEVKAAKESGISVIVTDHHTPQAELPDCITVNPVLQDNYTKLCGAGVALRLAEALTSIEYCAAEFLDICALSTVADLVPLTGDNRIIVRLGLQAINNNPRTGIKYLLKASGFKFKAPVTSYDIAFRVAPRLNAAGRLSTAEKSFKLLTETDGALLSLIAEELEIENRTRQDILAEITDEAFEILREYDLNSKRIIVLYKETWESGVIGIAASKISSEFGRPAVLLSKNGDLLKGSARSISGINIHELLTDVSEHLCSFGGHSMAAGLSLLPEKLEDFINAADKYITERYSDGIFLPTQCCDLSVGLSDLNLKLAGEMGLFEPFGMDNRNPVFAYNVKSLPFERIDQYDHIKCTVKRSVNFVAFNYAEYLPVLRSDMEKRVFFNIEKNIFNNIESVQCNVRGVEISEIKPTEDELLDAYTRTFFGAEIAVKNNKKRVKKSESGLYGHLVIAFTVKTYGELVSKYPSYRCSYGILESKNPINTILLAPFSVEGFGYYSKVEVYDATPAEFIRRIEADFDGEIIRYGNKPVFYGVPKICVDDLRDTYRLIKRLGIGRIKVEKLYDLAKYEGYKGDKVNLLLAYNIFNELNLLKEQSGRVTNAANGRVNLENSAIYRFMMEYE